MRGVHIVRAGRLRHWYIYAWRGKGAPLIRVDTGPVRPQLTKADLVAIAEAESTRTAQDSSRLDGALQLFRQSPYWRGLGERTRKLWGERLDRVEEKWGKVPLHIFTDPRMKPKLVAWRNSMAETPRAADLAIYAAARFCEWAVLEGLALANPAAHIPTIYRRQDRSPVIWLPHDIAAIIEHAAQPLRDALALAELTGLRRADLVALRWAEVGDLAIRRTTSKRSRGRRFNVTLPRLAALGALLDDLKTRPRKSGVETVLVNSHGKSFTGDGLATSFTDARRKANGGQGIWHTETDPDTGAETRIAKRLHDFRGTFATHLMTHPTARLTNAEIATMMGWSEEQVDSIRKRYVDDTAIVVALTRRLEGTL